MVIKPIDFIAKLMEASGDEIMDLIEQLQSGKIVFIED